MPDSLTPEHKDSARFPGYLFHRSAAKNMRNGCALSQGQNTHSLSAPGAAFAQCPQFRETESQPCSGLHGGSGVPAVSCLAMRLGPCSFKPSPHVLTNRYSGQPDHPVFLLHFEPIPDSFPLQWFLSSHWEFTVNIVLGAWNSLLWNAVSRQTFIGSREGKDCYSDHHLKPGWACGIQWHRQNSALTQAVPPVPHLWAPQHSLQGRFQASALLRWPGGSGRSLLPKPGSKMPSRYLHKSLLFA